MIVGLSGYARSGKDTVADILVANHGFRRVAFADKLREMLYALNPLVSDQNGWVTCQEVIDMYGWSGYKETMYGPEIRSLLQRLGTEAGREILGTNVWVHATFSDIYPEEDIVITDARFPNEAEGVVSRNGIMWRINRPGVEAANGHASETALDDWDFDFVIGNNGNIDDLNIVVEQLMKYWRGQRANWMGY